MACTWPTSLDTKRTKTHDYVYFLVMYVVGQDPVRVSCISGTLCMYVCQVPSNFDPTDDVTEGIMSERK